MKSIDCYKLENWNGIICVDWDFWILHGAMALTRCRCFWSRLRSVSWVSEDTLRWIFRHIKCRTFIQFVYVTSVVPFSYTHDNLSIKFVLLNACSWKIAQLSCEQTMEQLIMGNRNRPLVNQSSLNVKIFWIREERYCSVNGVFVRTFDCYILGRNERVMSDDYGFWRQSLWNYNWLLKRCSINCFSGWIDK